MDFFEAQALAKKRTSRLVLLFAFAVLGTIAAGYVAAMLAIGQVQPRARHIERSYWEYQRTAGWSDASPLTRWWDPRVLLWVAGGAVTIIGLSSLFKWSQMRAGGGAIAEMVGGRPVDPQTTDPHERRLLNIVEEMAIASGVPTPAVYVLDQEPCLNAFAAGLTTSDAAIAVTRGTLEKLSRDELQGVVGHEFSHILNGDMRLNVKLTAIVFGILVIGLIGRGILRSMGRGRVRVGGGKNKGGGLALILAVGLALLIVGYVGYFFGRLIQAAVSRQREFLADASAVQFTRNPGGIAGALKKIGGYALGGHMQSEKSAEIGHFFFSQTFKSSFGGWWATHPPLGERIRAIEPSWDGQLFEPPEAVDITRESFATAGFGGGSRHSPDETVRHVQTAPAVIPPRPPLRTIPFHPTSVVADVGMLAAAQIGHAQALLQAIPARLREAARDPRQACAVVYALLLSSEPATRDKQLALIARLDGPDVAAGLPPVRAALSILDPIVRLPLVQLCAAALRQLDPVALDRFITTLDELVHADAAVSPYEFGIQKMLVRHLNLARQQTYRGTEARAAAQPADLAVVLSVLARIGSRDADAVQAAFDSGAAHLDAGTGVSLLPPDRCTLEQLDAALDRLADCALPAKKSLLTAAAHVVGADGTVTVEEGDLFRAIAAAIDCPMPLLGVEAA